jgi:signal transduction histidine kinase
MNHYPKDIARLARAFDRGLFPLCILAASLLASLALAFAELAGLDGLCVTGIDELVFVACSALCSACLVLDCVLRKSASLRWPLVFGALSCLALVLYFPATPISALAIAMYVALPLSLYCPFPRSLAYSAAAIAAFFALRFAVFPPEAYGMKSASLRDGLFFLALPAAAAFPASVAAAFRAEMDRAAEALMEVTRLNLSYQSYSASLEEKTALEERLRLTRDLHDVVGYALTNTIMTLRAAALMCDREPERVPAFLDAARDDSEKALERVRGMLGEVRRREIRYAAGPSSIARAVRAFRAATGAEVDLDYGNFDWSLGGEAALTASHFVQEGMLNAVSHGKATAIRVSFRESEGALLVSVKDNGAGAKAVQEGIGIAGMRERIERLGGSLEYGSSGLGFAIEMRIPLGPREEADDAEASSSAETKATAEARP